MVSNVAMNANEPQIKWNVFLFAFPHGKIPPQADFDTFRFEGIRIARDHLIKKYCKMHENW